MLPQATRSSRRPLQQSSATEASTAPSTDTHTESHGAHGTRESHGASKYVEAMRNPDWRRKDANSQESELNRSDPPGLDRAAQRRSSSRNIGTDGSHEMEHSPDSSGSWDLIDFGPPRAVQQHCRDEQARRESASKAHQQAAVNKYFEVPPGFCQLVTPKELPNGWPMSLIEVRPVSKHQAAIQDPEVKMLHVRRADELPFVGFQPITRNLSDEQSEQFAAALQAAESTPRKVKRPSQIPVMAHNDTQTHSNMITGHHRDNVQHYTAVADVSRLKTNELANNRLQPAKGHQVPVNSSKRGLDSRYNKLLEKLQKGSTDKLSTRREARPSDASFEKTYSVVSLPGTAQPLGISAERRESRLTNSSDSGYASADVAGELLNSQKVPNASFNPRAQEFLSFSGKKESSEEASEDDDRHSKFRRSVPIKELFEKSMENAQAREANRRRQSLSSEPGTSPSHDTSNTICAPGGFFNYLGLPPQGILGHPLSGLNMFPSQGHIQTPPINPAPFSNFALSGSVPGGFMPGPGPTNFMGMGNTGPSNVPMQGWGANPSFSAMAGQQATGAALNNRPQSVPKPRRPDPSNQQAYEAWIEWRKANEPGYAMECKLRQQRRSQRNVTTAPTPKVDEPPMLETTGEVAASA